MSDNKRVERTERTAASSSSSSWSSKEITCLKEVIEKIPNGSNVYISSTAATPQAILKAMVDSWKLVDVKIIQMIPGGDLPHLTENVDRFRTCSFFSYTRSSFYKPEYTSSTSPQREGLADYTPISISAIPRLLEEKNLQVDIAIIKVTNPHKGFCSLGMGVECSQDFIKHAKIVIAEVCQYMPWTEGPSKIHTDDIDWWIQNDEPLLSSEELWPDFIKNSKHHPKSILNGIGENVIKLIPDGATLKLGWSPITFSVIPFLHQRKNLGLHTDVYSHSLFQLQADGIINNTQKTLNNGRTVVSQAHGENQDFYEYLDRNPAIEFHPSSYVNNLQILSQIKNLVAIVGALKVDLTGQVATDSIAHKFYGGVWSANDSIRGARLSDGGKPIVAVPSKSLQGRSNIVFSLPPGTGVSITRSDVEYVVTEYGIAYLYGKSIRERCLCLIDVAHPDFRQGLLTEAKNYHYISQSQPGNSFKSTYPQEFEQSHKTKRGKDVFIRPIKAVDEDSLRNFFHTLSDHSVYLRYFRKMPSIPLSILQKTTDVDYSNDMALVVMYPLDKAPREIVGIAQWALDYKDGVPEIAFQVRDDWQGEGLGKYLYLSLVKVGMSYGISQFKADVLADNKAMKGVFEHSNVPFTCRTDLGVITYTFDLKRNVVN